MHSHRENFRIQTSGSACLYNLTKGDLISNIHPIILVNIVETTLYAMEHFPAHTQLQKNILLILCNGNMILVCILNVFNFYLKFSDRKIYILLV